MRRQIRDSSRPLDYDIKLGDARTQHHDTNLPLNNGGGGFNDTGNRKPGTPYETAHLPCCVGRFLQLLAPLPYMH